MSFKYVITVFLCSSDVQPDTGDDRGRNTKRRNTREHYGS